MTPGKREQAKKIFAEVIRAPVGERDALVSQLCEGDTCLKSEIIKLLAAEDPTRSFLETSRREPVLPVAARERWQSLQIGQIIGGRFQIQHLIGTGGMGEVYQAWDFELQQKVALKTIRHAIAAHPDTISRFKAEVKESLRITHPNVCRVYQLACHQNAEKPIWFLTMELLDGCTLRECLERDGPVAKRRGVTLIRQMIAGLACAHRAGIVHRDLKPSNLMLVGPGTTDEKLVITDFGLAMSTSSTRDSQGAGTPAYMAPEQLTARQIGPPTDIFAMGLIICELFTGKHPKLDVESAKTCAKQLNGWLAAHPGVPRQLRPIIRRCLRVVPEERFRDASVIPPLLESHQRNMIGAGLAACVVVTVVVTLGAIKLPQLGDRIINEVQVTPNNTLSGEPSLSADGKYLAYMSNRADPGNMDIWLQTISVVDPRRLTTLPGERRTPSISPDGKLIAFRSERNGGGIYLIGADGTGERLLIAEGRNPVFSPDSSSVAYWVGSEDTHVSGHVYIIVLKNGAVRSLAANFIDARYPSWNPVGRLLFLGCQTPRPEASDCSEWWAVDPNGGVPENTGILALLRKQRIQPVFPPQIARQGNHILISGRKERGFHIWDIPTSGPTSKAVGSPLQITFGEHDEMGLAVAENGVIAVEHVTGALHLWRVAIGRTSEQPAPEKLTDSVELDCCPAVSGDGQSLFFARQIGEFRQLMKLELTSGKESMVYPSHREETWPLPDYNGRVVAFESRSGDHTSIDLWTKDGVHTWCNDCSHPSSWLSPGRQLLYATSAGDIAVLNVATGMSHTIVSAGPGRVLSYPDYNAVNGYLLFTATAAGQQEIIAAQLQTTERTTAGAWIPLTPTMENAYMGHWSKDGAKFFYLSQRDGYYCLWSNSFNPARGVVGRPSPVQHYHDLGNSPTRTFPHELGMSVASDWIYIDPGESTSTIWQAQLQRNRFWALTRQLIAH